MSHTRRRVGVVIDLDDTILATSTVYYQLYTKMCSYFYQYVSPMYVAPGRLLELYALVERGRMPADVEQLYAIGGQEVFSSDPDGFPRTLTLTFSAACLEAGKVPSVKALEHVHEIGRRIYTAKYTYMPGARRMLSMLFQCRSFDMFVLTQGPPALQKPKLDDPWFSKFHRIIIVPMETSKGDVIVDLMAEFPNHKRWVMVGDSVKRDINPALAVGAMTVHIKQAMDDRENEKVLWLPPAEQYRYQSCYDWYQAQRYVMKARTLD